jgi:hypothetical protein
MAQIKKIERSEKDLTPKQRLFVDILVANWGEISYASKDKLKRFRRLDKLSKEAEKNKQYNVSVQAEYRSGQLAGLYVDKREVKVSGLEGMSRNELENKLKELSNKIDGYNAKTIEIETEEPKKIKNQ